MAHPQGPGPAQTLLSKHQLELRCLLSLPPVVSILLSEQLTTSLGARKGRSADKENLKEESLWPKVTQRSEWLSAFATLPSSPHTPPFSFFWLMKCVNSLFPAKDKH